MNTQKIIEQSGIGVLLASPLLLIFMVVTQFYHRGYFGFGGEWVLFLVMFFGGYCALIYPIRKEIKKPLGKVAR